MDPSEEHFQDPAAGMLSLWSAALGRGREGARAEWLGRRLGSQLHRWRRCGRCFVRRRLSAKGCWRQVPGACLGRHVGVQ